MKQSFIIALALIFSFVGIADSWYLYQSAISGADLSCDIGAGLDGCNTVAQSEYSRVFGIPLALYGAVFFAFMFTLSAIVSLFPRRVLYRLFYLASIFGALASVVFISIQFAFIKAVCIYCVLSAVFTFILFFIGRTLWRRYRLGA